MKVLIILSSIILFSFRCSTDKQDISPKQLMPLSINIGNDTTITYGDTLTLNAGPGYVTYNWNDGLAFDQTFNVTTAGTYWVKVRDENNRTGSDTIKVDTCMYTNTTKFFTHYSVSLPCSFKISSNTGDDSFSFEARSAKQDIVLHYERYAQFEYDTVFTLPDTYRNETNIKKTVENEDGKVIGISYSKKTSANFRDIKGFFLLKENDYYLELLQLSYASEKENKVLDILSTINKI